MERINPTKEDLISLGEDYRTREKKEFSNINLTKEQLIIDYFISIGCVDSTAKHFKLPVDKISKTLENCGLL